MVCVCVCGGGGGYVGAYAGTSGFLHEDIMNDLIPIQRQEKH